MNTIWCLFSVANEYNQPENNLVAWWPAKPSKVQIGIAINHVTASPAVESLHTLEYWRGDCGADYRLAELSPGPVV